MKQVLERTHDPVLSDLDSHDLIQAGLMKPGSIVTKKQPIRMSTIDNYQGEECKIVIISLTRSNNNGDIGFMKSPERLTVLLSRAREGMIMIGNAQTFLASKRGSDHWRELMQKLEAGGHVYDGIPLRCVKHPESTRTIKSAEEFDIYSPDGGCDSLW